MLEHLPVRGEDPGPGNETQVFPIAQHRKIVAAAFGKLPGHFLHLIRTLNGPLGRMHQIADQGIVIHILVKHDVPDIVQLYDAFQIVLFINHRVDIPAGLGNYLDQVPEGLIGLNGFEVGLN